MEIWETDGFYTDLACERRRADADVRGVLFTKESVGALVWERVLITSTEGERCLGRPMGRYDTLHLPSVCVDEEIADAATEELSSALLGILSGLSHFPARLLIVGLGNARLTTDALGARTAERIHATLHLAREDKRAFRALDCAEIAVVSPGVSAQSGMDACEIVEAVAEKLHPDAVIAVDALAAREKQRLGRSIQLSDTGLFPGSGVGSCRRPVTFETLGIPVIAVGVPTVIDARLLVADAAEACGMKRETAEKMIRSGEEGYFVSPKNIDDIVNNCSQIIADSVNAALGVVL